MNSDVFDDPAEQIAFGIRIAREAVGDAQVEWDRYRARVLRSVNRVEPLLADLCDLANRYPGDDADPPVLAAWAMEINALLTRPVTRKSRKDTTDG